MSVITDACSLVNIYKAGLDGAVQLDPCMRVCLGPIVAEEIWPQTGIDNGAFAVPRGRVRELPAAVGSGDLATFMAVHRLGPGESECIILADRLGYFVLSDDKRARRVATSLLGEQRVLGTLGVALNIAKMGGASINSVFHDYDHARRQGAFLPAHSMSTFSLAVAGARRWPCGPECQTI